MEYSLVGATNGSLWNSTFIPDANISHSYKDVKYVLDYFVNMPLCIFGILGNILNIVVLTHRRMTASSEAHMECIVYTGLANLAFSDMCYCLLSFVQTLIDIKNSSSYFDQAYTYCSIYLRNMFSYVSTWLTVILTLGRYYGVCHPLRTRVYVMSSQKVTKILIIIIVCVYLLWGCLSVPELLIFTICSDVVTSDSNSSSLVIEYYLDSGPLDYRIWGLFSIIWQVFGFFIPFVIMLFCNIRLLQTLKKSAKFQQQQYSSSHHQYSTHRLRISPTQDPVLTKTLIIIIILFVVLVSPSEIINILSNYKVLSSAHIQLAISITNVLNTANFATNFALYCMVNVHFRHTLTMLCGHRSLSSSSNGVVYSSRSSQSTTYKSVSTMLWNSILMNNTVVMEAQVYFDMSLIN